MFTFFNSLFLASFPENKSESCQIEENTKNINMNVITNICKKLILFSIFTGTNVSTWYGHKPPGPSSRVETDTETVLKRIRYPYLHN